MLSMLSLQSYRKKFYSKVVGHTVSLRFLVRHLNFHFYVLALWHVELNITKLVHLQQVTVPSALMLAHCAAGSL